MRGNLNKYAVFKNVEDFSKFFTETKEIGDFRENTNVLMIFAKTKKFCQNILIFTIFLYEAKTGQSHQYRRVFHFQLVHQVLSRL